MSGLCVSELPGPVRVCVCTPSAPARLLGVLDDGRGVAREEKFHTVRLEAAALVADTDGHGRIRSDTDGV